MKPRTAIAINSMFGKVHAARLSADQYLYRNYLNKRVEMELEAFKYDLRSLLRKHSQLWTEARGFLKPQRDRIER